MNLDEIKARWQEQQLAQADQQFEHLLQEVRHKAQSLEQTILRRDLVEAGAAVFVVFAFSWALWFVPLPPVSVAGAVVCILGAIEIVGVMHWARTVDPLPASDAPLPEFAAAELKRVNRQIQLLNNVTWWYSGPILLGAALILGGILWSVPELPAATSALFSLGFALCLLLSARIIHQINRRASENTLTPQRKQLEELLAACDLVTALDQSE